jgi:hypothetical protein
MAYTLMDAPTLYDVSHDLVSRRCADGVPARPHPQPIQSTPCCRGGFQTVPGGADANAEAPFHRGSGCNAGFGGSSGRLQVRRSLATHKSIDLSSAERCESTVQSKGFSSSEAFMCNRIHRRAFGKDRGSRHGYGHALLSSAASLLMLVVLILTAPHVSASNTTNGTHVSASNTTNGTVSNASSASTALNTTAGAAQTQTPSMAAPITTPNPVLPAQTSGGQTTKGTTGIKLTGTKGR